MKKFFRSYAAYWLVFLALFHVVTFVSRAEWGYVDGSETSFWIGYVSFLAMFIFSLYIGWVAFSADSNTEMFYNESLLFISITGLICSAIVSGFTMLRPYLDAWIDFFGMIVAIADIIITKLRKNKKFPVLSILLVAAVCLVVKLLSPEMRPWCGIVSAFLILGSTALDCIGAMAAAEAVSDTDEKLRNETLFIRNLTAEAQSLVSRSADPDTKKLLTKVYEAIRYSSPRSIPELADLEEQISRKFSMLSEFLDDPGKVSNISKELLDLISERNSKAKLYK